MLSERAKHSDNDLHSIRDSRSLQEVWDSIEAVMKPIIACVTGTAVRYAHFFNSNTKCFCSMEVAASWRWPAILLSHRRMRVLVNQRFVSVKIEH